MLWPVSYLVLLTYPAKPMQPDCPLQDKEISIRLFHISIVRGVFTDYHDVQLFIFKKNVVQNHKVSHATTQIRGSPIYYLNLLRLLIVSISWICVLWGLGLLWLTTSVLIVVSTDCVWMPPSQYPEPATNFLSANLSSLKVKLQQDIRCLQTGICNLTVHVICKAY